jgi:hypothetical protein
VGPECQSLGLTAPRPRRPLLDSGHRLARTHGLGATISPSTVSPPPHRRHPPPLAVVMGAHPDRGAPFLPPLPFPPPRAARSGLPPTDSTMPRAPRRRVEPPCTASCRPPPPDAAPAAIPLQPTTPRYRVCSSGELFLPAAPKRVHHPTALLPGPSPLHLVASRRRNPAGPPPAPPWLSALPCLDEINHQPKWLG